MNFANGALSTLAADITAGATTLTVADPSRFPAAPFHLAVEEELMTVTVAIGSTFTVARGIEGTTAIAHAKGAPLAQTVTAADFASFLTSGVTSFNTRTGAVTLNSTDVNAVLSAGNNITLSNAGGVVTIAVANTVTSWNSRTGAVVLNTTDIASVLQGSSTINFTITGGHFVLSAPGLIVCAAWMKRTTAQTIPDATVTQVAFNSAVVDSTGGQCNTSTGAITVANTGDYVISLNLLWNNLHANCRVTGQILVNGTQVLGCANRGVSGDQISVSASKQVSLNANDIITCTAFNNSGSSETLIAGLQTVEVSQLAGQ